MPATTWYPQGLIDVHEIEAPVPPHPDDTIFKDGRRWLLVKTREELERFSEWTEEDVVVITLDAVRANRSVYAWRRARWHRLFYVYECQVSGMASGAIGPETRFIIREFAYEQENIGRLDGNEERAYWMKKHGVDIWRFRPGWLGYGL